MRKVFWDDPYQTILTTRVAAVNDNCLLFDETIAFSFSGGQESDKVMINQLAVLHSEIVDHQIYYTLPADHGLVVGDSITMAIDWLRRYRLMRLHFAAELVLELVIRILTVEKIGAHIGESKARIDFVSPQNISVVFAELLAQYSAIIDSDLPILTGFSDEATQRRFWQIAGFAKVPCGGTHVKSTKEVGMISLKRVNIGAGKERIDITLTSPG